jgi:hypothetical protein
MLRNYIFVWLTITFGGSLINTFYWWLDEMVFNKPNPGFNYGPNFFIGVFVIGCIASSLCSFPSILLIYLIEGWKKIPFTIWLHVAFFVIHLVAIYLFDALDEDVLAGFIGYEIAGIVGYYVFVHRKQNITKDQELLDS